MKKNTVLTVTELLLFLVGLSACGGDHFITDRAYRKKVEQQFELRKELAAHRSEQLFAVFDGKMTTREREALEFLYAYMSLNDLADYSGEFFLSNIRASFAARDTFNWGQQVPDDLFRHFVLPIRVNNENLDSSRIVFFAELKDRIKTLGMKDAVLEVNHWCHEKVTYKGTDGRTSAPLATVKTAFGRCGEESTFTVAALRSVGIPARQCYTPRWAHSDDNHAWVEVWVDGRWHFIGACEPDADLDLAWFTKPAKRAMLVNTTVFGDYSGPEEVLQKDPLFTRINVLQHYAPVRKITALVTDSLMNPADSALVEFQLYNYAEFYPLHKTVTGENGCATFTTGAGDLIVWAASGDCYGWKKMDVRLSDTVKVILNRKPGDRWDASIDLVPPAEGADTAKVSDSARKRNNERLAFEDKLREAYESTFIDSAKSVRFAEVVRLHADTVWDFLRRSRGNWREITAFITGAPAGRHHHIFPLLGSISEKDLRDTDTAVLMDHLVYSTVYPPLTTDPQFFASYILSPRIDNEWMRPWRHYFQRVFSKGFADSCRLDPMHAASWIRNNIRLNKTDNYSRAPLTPSGVYELRVSDSHSADILFVALCRSFGIPSRLDPATKVPQFLAGERWNDLYLFEAKENAPVRGMVTLENSPANGKHPEYYIHYTLEPMKNGFFRSLDYEGSPLVSSFPCTLEVPEGPCLLVTGNRLPGGAVMVNMTAFHVVHGETAIQRIALRETPASSDDYGRLNPALFEPIPVQGLILAWVEPGKEPTRHLLAELREKKAAFGQAGSTMVMIFGTEEEMKRFVVADRAGLPEKFSWSWQATFPVRLTDLRSGGVAPVHLPVVLLVDKTGTIRYFSEGYHIGIAGELVDAASRLK